jgi:hypothetical protein
MVAKLSNIIWYWSTTRHGFDKHVKKKKKKKFEGGVGGKGGNPSPIMGR